VELQADCLLEHDLEGAALWRSNSHAAKQRM